MNNCQYVTKCKLNIAKVDENHFAMFFFAHFAANGTIRQVKIFSVAEQS